MRRALTVLFVLFGCESPSPPDSGALNDAGPALPPCLEVTPSALDFGEVELSLAPLRNLTLVNKTSIARLVHSRARTAPSFLSMFDEDDVLLQSGETLQIGVRFFPSDARLHLARLDLTAGENCDATVALRGLGSGSVSLEPQLVDFGFVDPGQSKTIELRLSNTRRAPVLVAQLWLEGGGVPAFSVDLPAGPFELPAMSSRSFVITARPSHDFFYEAQLVANTEFGLQRVPLRVAGGAPVVEVPASIDVQLAPFEPWFRPVPSVRRAIRIRNASTAPLSPVNQLELLSPRATVELADGGAIGVSADGSLLEVEVVTTPLFTLGPTESTEIPVRVTPRGVGQHHYRIHVFTNDPVTPERVVALNVNAETLGRCWVRVEPQTELTLTPVIIGRTRGTISFINEGPNRCVIDDPRIGTTGYAIANPVPQLIVEPWQTGTLTIEGPGPGMAGTGIVSFHVLNSVGQPESILLHVPQ